MRKERPPKGASVSLRCRLRSEVVARDDIEAGCLVSPINAFLQQHVGDNESLETCFAKLKELAVAGG